MIYSTAEQFYKQLLATLEDSDQTGFTSRDIGRAVDNATARIRSRMLPAHLHLHALVRKTLTPADLHADDTFLGLVGIADTDVYAVALPNNYGMIEEVRGDGFLCSFSGSYDRFLINTAQAKAPVVMIHSGYILIAPKTVSALDVLYYRRPYHSYEEGSGVWATATPNTLTVSTAAWDIGQWANSVAWQADASGVFTEASILKVSTNPTATVCNITDTPTAATRNYRLFRLPDVHELLLPAVLYQAAIEIEGEDLTGDWMKHVDSSIQNWMESGGAV